MKTRLKLYFLTGELRISMHTYMRARSAKEAIAKALELPLGRISDGDCHGEVDEDAPSKGTHVWLTSGELDGEPQDIEAEEVEDG